MSDFRYKAIIVSYPINLLIICIVFALGQYPKEWYVYCVPIVWIATAILAATKMPSRANKNSFPEKLIISLVAVVAIYYGTAAYFWMGGVWKIAAMTLFGAGLLICGAFSLAVFWEDRFISEKTENKEDEERERLIRAAERDDDIEMEFAERRRIRQEELKTMNYLESVIGEPTQEEEPKLRLRRRKKKPVIEE